MTPRPTALLAAFLACVTLVAAQPAPPQNLRLGNAPKAVAPPECEVTPSALPAHAYYDALVKRTEHYCNWSLRSQAQLNGLVSDPVATNFTYDPLNDNYADKQDAAKFVRSEGGSSSIPGSQQLKFNFRNAFGPSDTALLTWDWYWGKEFRTNRGAVTAYKMFQMVMDGHGWWTLMSRLAAASDSDTGEVGKASDEFRSGVLADGVVQRSPFYPTGMGAVDSRRSSGGEYGQRHSVWSRYWIEIRFLRPPSEFTEWSSAHLGGRPLGPNPEDPQGRWHMVSLWMADETRNAQRLLYRVPINWNSALNWEPTAITFRFEMNTSQDPLSLIGPLIGYGRNVVLLRNYSLPPVAETDSLIFQRPRR